MDGWIVGWTGGWLEGKWKGIWVDGLSEITVS